MKTNSIKGMACLAAVSAVLAWAGGVAQADNYIDYQTPFNNGASGTWWINGWGGQAAASGATTAFFNAPSTGSFNVYDYLPGGDQFVAIGWYAGAWYDPAGGATNLLRYTNIVFDVLWDTNNSTIGIDTFNSYGELWRIWAVGDGNSWIDLGGVPIPDAASNGWVTCNVPINPSISGISSTWGLGYKKWTGSGYSGTAAFYIDNVGLQRSALPPPPPTLTLSSSIIPGLNLYCDGGQYDRQNVATVVTNVSLVDYNYGWIGNGTPVSYSLDITEFPTNNGFQAHIMLMPGDNITENAPDWNESDAMVLFINNQTNGSTVASLRYKLNNAGNNSYLFGSDTNVFGPNPGQPTTNTIVAGYGGLLGTVTNFTGGDGTWTITMSSDVDITLTSPSGNTSTMAFPQESDAQAFASPVTVFWGQQPNTAGYSMDVVFHSVSITGSATPLSVDLTQPLNPVYMAARGADNPLIFTTPSNAVYWLQWTLPDVGFGLESGSSLAGPWASVVGPSVLSTNFTEPFTTSASLASSRTYNPPPTWVGYDFGNATAESVSWAAGPTYDAGGSGGSGSVELNWTWVYSTDGGVDFTMDLGATAFDCTGGTLSFDIMIDPSSTAGGYGDYGYFQVISRDGSYTWNDTGYGAGLLTAAGGSVGNWGHVNIPLTGADNQVRALTFQVYNDAGRSITGTQTIYIDNIQLTKSTATGPALYTVGGQHSLFITSPMLPSSGAGFFRLLSP